MISRRAIMAGGVSAPLLTGCAGLQGRAADDAQVVQLNGFVVSGTQIVFNGTVTDQAVAQFEELRASRDGIETLVLERVDGAQGSTGAFALGREVRAAGLTTQAPADAQLSGAGVDVFLAGSRRRIEDGATLRLRGTSIEAASEYAIYLQEMTGGTAMAEFIDADAPRLRMRALTTAEGQRLALATDGIDMPFGLEGRPIE